MAMYNLAMLYLQGEGGLNIDVSMAMSLLETAASSGLVDAQRELGVLYTESDHKDMVRAAQLFNMAATQKVLYSYKQNSALLYISGTAMC